MVGFVICSDKRHTPSGESWDTLYRSLVLLLPLLLGTSMAAGYAVMALGSLDSFTCLDSPTNKIFPTNTFEISI